MNLAALPVAGLVLGAPAMLLLGLSTSPHCALMCAPLTQFAGARGGLRAPLALNLGRLSSYAALGALAGGVGGALLLALERSGVGQALRWAVVVMLLVLAALQWRASRPRPACCAAQRAPQLQRLPPYLRGLLWGLLPCPLLYAVLGLAALSGGAAQGALLLLSFGVGTAPLLLAASGVGAWIGRRLGERPLQRASALLLTVAGLWIAATTPLVATALSAYCRP